MKRTVYVLGAGASAEFGLPVGSGLRTMIVDLLKRDLPNLERLEESDSPFAMACKSMDARRDDLLTAGEIIRAGIHFTNSIDDFLLANANRPVVLQVGRLAIAAAMLAAENQSGNHIALDGGSVDARAKALGLLDTWIGTLFRYLRGLRQASEAKGVFENISFIVFNYDRCLEQFLYWSFRDAFYLGHEEVLEILKDIKIVHVYGSLGDLPVFNSENGVSYAEQRVDLVPIAARLRTYSEGAATEDIEHEIAEIMDAAEQVVFLGYAFHQQGLDLLYPNGPRAGQLVAGTRRGLSDEARGRSDLIVGDAGQRFEAAQCKQFLDNSLLILTA